MGRLFNRRAVGSALTIILVMSITGPVVMSDFETTIPLVADDNNTLPGYVPHSPIRINSNADFVAFGFNGSGTETEPWVIENLDINGSGYGCCVYVGNTTDYFTIQNCYLHGAKNGVSDPYYYNSGVILYTVQNGSITSNNITSNDYNGIYLYLASRNMIVNNNVSNNRSGIRLMYSIRNYMKNNVVFLNNWEDITVSCDSNNNTITNNDISKSCYGVFINDCENNIVSSNMISKNFYGITIDEPGSINNEIFQNTISDNEYFGLYIMASSSNNKIYHNNFINNWCHATVWYGNGTRLLYSGVNQWDNGYPSGGNYWDNYTGIDMKCGALQNQLGSDGIGDNPCIITINSNKDNYPLMSPFNYTEYNIPLQQGWNLISLPVRQLNNSIGSVLETIAGKWDCIQTYEASDVSDHWKSNLIYRPASLNDLESMNHLQGYWINITEPGVILTVKGDNFGSPLSIPLYAGWNLVGYPTLNTTTTVANVLWGTGADRVEVCDPTDPYRTREVGPMYLMKPGEGYWIHVPADSIWVVNW